MCAQHARNLGSTPRRFRREDFLQRNRGAIECVNVERNVHVALAIRMHTLQLVCIFACVIYICNVRVNVPSRCELDVRNSAECRGLDVATVAVSDKYMMNSRLLAEQWI